MRGMTRWLLLGAGLAAVAAAAAVLVVFAGGRDRGGGGGGAAMRNDEPPAQGAAISLIVHAAGSPERPLGPGDTVQPGAQLRLELHAARRGYVAVLGVDGSGEVTVHYPPAGMAPAGFDPRDRMLPGATAFDATPGDERLVAVHAERPFSLDAVVAAVRAGGALPAGVVSSEVVLHKAELLPSPLP